MHKSKQDFWMLCFSLRHFTVILCEIRQTKTNIVLEYLILPEMQEDCMFNWHLTLQRPPDVIVGALSLVHTSDISISNENKAWLLLWDLRRQNNENFSLFRLLFCSWFMLGLWSYAYAYEDPYVAGLTLFLCFALRLILMLSCEPGLKIYDTKDLDTKQRE